MVGRVALEVRVAQEPLRLHVEGAQVGGRLVALGLRLADARRAGGVRAPDDAAAFLQTQPSDGQSMDIKKQLVYSGYGRHCTCTCIVH